MKLYAWMDEETGYVKLVSELFGHLVAPDKHHFVGVVRAVMPKEKKAKTKKRKGNDSRKREGNDPK